MSELSDFLVKSILNEDTPKQVVALFGGGFKPPTKGHLEVVNQGIKTNPEVSEVKILVGGGERNGFTQDQAVKIWNLYNDIGFIDKPATIIPVSSPFTYYKNYLKDNPDDKVYVFIGSRPEDEKDQMDVKQRSEFVKKYSDNVIPVEVSTTGGVSGTLARKLFKTDIDSFRNMFPENLLDEDFEKILDILNNKSTDNTQKSAPKATEPLTPLSEAIIGDKILCDNCGWSWKIIDGGDDLFICHKCGFDNELTLEEGRKKKKDPKKGTGKKPKGSGRRLYTDEDPSDTVGIKFSTRQDIVDTLNKKSFKAKSHARQSQIINLIHQRVRAALSRTKDPAKKKKLKSGFEYIKGKKEASKAKTQRLKKQKSKNENINEIGDAGMRIRPWRFDGAKSDYRSAEQFKMYLQSTDNDGGEYTGESWYKFTTEQGTDYEVQIDYTWMDDPKYSVGFIETAGVDFYAGDAYDGRMDKSMSMTNKGEVFEVMATVTDIVLSWLNEWDKVFYIDSFIIEPKIEESERGMMHSPDFKAARTKRGRLYQAYIEKQISKLDTKYTVNDIQGRFEITPIGGKKQKLNEDVLDQTSLVLPRGKKIYLQAEEEDYDRGLIVELSGEGGYKINYWYGDDAQVYPVEVEIDGESIKPDAKEVYLKFHPYLKNENIDPESQKKHKGKSAPFGSAYKPVNEQETTHKVIAKGVVFEPKNLTINVGDTVKWVNKQGVHNVNGKKSHERNQNNPESFGNKVGSGWTYEFTFNKPGLYKYHCDPHLSADMVGTIEVKDKIDETTKFVKGRIGTRYRAIEKRGDKYYYTQDDPLGQGIRQEFGPYKTKAAAKRKMGTFPPAQNYRDITEFIDKIIDEKLCKRGYNYIAKRKREGEKHNPFLTSRAVKVCKGQIKGSDGKMKKDFRPKKGKKRSAQGRKPDIVKEIGIDLTNYDGQILPGDVLRAPKGFPLGGKKLESSKQLKVIKNNREGVNRYKLSLEDKDGKKYSVRNFEMDGEYKGKKLPKWGLVRKSKKNINEIDYDSIFRTEAYIKTNLSDRDQGDILSDIRSLPGVTIVGSKEVPNKPSREESILSIKVDPYPFTQMDNVSAPEAVDYISTEIRKIKGVERFQVLKKRVSETKPLNENATYTNHIDFKQQIRDLTKHMIKKGMNILPLPRVIFKHSDTENASKFLGKTAYYSPSDTTVVLYTEGRHPKDIARSFAHEMIHHIQHLEGRLHDINTTNTNDDDHLNDIEREAYTRGNMVFRNWTDGLDGEEVTSLSEKKKPYKHKSGFNDKLGKDPFGLNQFAREIMGETEKPIAESVEKQEEVRIFNPNCGCDKT